MTKVNSLKRNSPNYPEILKHIDPPPKQLYFSGLAPETWLGRPKVAIVGSRKATAYGLGVTDQLAGTLAKQGIVIISGLAYGIDKAAHQAAMAAGGLTVAVLPTSLQSIYPAGHLNLAVQVAGQGTLISEYGPNDPVYKLNFTQRNRIISGLADVVIITEAAVKSGSLVTARFALEQGKTVMAVPGNINSENSQGANNLIKSGAVPVTEAGDVLFALNIRPSKTRAKQTFKGSADEERVLKMIIDGVNDQEELALKAQLDGGQTSAILTSLEITGHIRPAGSGRWVSS
ncbi:MAG TPA: DNA-processing protein DprA [Candidatus Saccharimonadales bacterium]|nr:DNA-processing protein DprA [Candidatus Saccharimonadales bacterium]